MRGDIKHEVPYFLSGEYQLTPANIRPQADRDLDRLLKVKKAEGYIEALNDLRRGLKTCNSFTLVSIEPAVRNLLLKAEYYSEAAK